MCGCLREKRLLPAAAAATAYVQTRLEGVDYDDGQVPVLKAGKSVSATATAAIYLREWISSFSLMCVVVLYIDSLLLYLRYAEPAALRALCW